MCTAVSERHLFGRTLDLERSFGEAVVITPRRFALPYLYRPPQTSHLAMIGMAHVAEGRPLYYDAVNEAGLAIAALSFPHACHYHPPAQGKINLASFELLPFVLGQCRGLGEAAALLCEINLTPDAFLPSLPPTPLHWLIADGSGSLVVESRQTGLEITQNPFGVLTNAPEFSYHSTRVADFMQLGARPPENRLAPELDLSPYSRGMGALGLPGDFSSSSRFTRAFFAKTHTVKGDTPTEEISRFFHVMDTVSLPRGIALTEEGMPILTLYTSCIDTKSGAYHFTTYRSRRIRTVQLRNADLDASRLTAFPTESEEDALALN